MGMKAGETTGGLNSEINITPLADVMLVLLIIVMLIAPLLQKGVDVTLPEAANTTEKQENDEQTVLAVTADGRFYVDQVQVSEQDLLREVQTVSAGQGRCVVKILLSRGPGGRGYRPGGRGTARNRDRRGIGVCEKSPALRRAQAFPRNT